VRKLAAPGATVAVLGMSYKPDTPVVEESQGLMIARALAQAGHMVLVSDPVALDSAVAVLGEEVTAVRGAEDAVAQASVVVVTTPDRAFAALPASCFAGKVVVDFWRILPAAVADGADVVHLGRGK
jgi:UDPglucose 6-dehydrogenase